VRDFNGLKAHYWGQPEPGPTGEPMKPDPTKIQYMPVYFNRNSVITFEKDQPVFLPEDNGGTTWVYKNYTKTVDPTLTYEDLPKLDKRLKSLPAGYKFRTKTLDRDLIIKAVDGKVRIMWDERGGSWDALDPAWPITSCRRDFPYIKKKIPQKPACTAPLPWVAWHAFIISSCPVRS